MLNVVAPPGYHGAPAFYVICSVVCVAYLIFVDMRKCYLNSESHPCSFRMVLAIERIPWLTNLPSNPIRFRAMFAV